MSGEPLYPELSERAALGAAFYDNNITSDLQAMLNADQYYLGRHQLIHTIQGQLFQRDGTFNVLTVAEALKAIGKLEGAGGLTYLKELLETCPDPYDWRGYAAQVREAAIRRKLLNVSKQIESIARDQAMPLLEVATSAEAAVYEATSSIAVGRKQQNFISIIEDWANDPQEIRGFTLGFAEMDALIGGFGEHALVGLLGYSSSGKSIMLAQLLQRFLEYKHSRGRTARGLVVPTEMSIEAWQIRLVASLLGSNYDVLKKGQFRDRKRLQEAERFVAEMAVDYLEGSHPTGEQVISAVRRYDPDFVIVDGLSDMGGDDNEMQRTSKNMEALHEIDQGFGKFVVYSVQMNNDSKQRKLKQPNPRDARGSPQRIWQMSTHFLTMYRPAQLVETGEVEEEDDPRAGGISNPNITEFRLAKDRNSPNAGLKIDLDFRREHGQHGFFPVNTNIDLGY